MNIAFVSEFFPPYITGGAEIFLNELAGYLQTRGHKIVVITTEQGQDKGKFGALKIKSSPLHFSHRYQFHGLTVPWMFRNKRLVEHLKKTYEKENTDLVYINNLFHLSFAPLQAAESLGIPVVIDVHDYWPICFSKDMLYRVDPYGPCSGEQSILKCSRCLAKKMKAAPITPLLMPGLFIEKRLRKKWLASSVVKKVLCHSKEGVEELAKHGIKGSSVPYPYLGPMGKHISVGDGVFRMLFVSRLERVRGAHILLDVAKHFQGKFKFRIDVIGKGSLMKELDRNDLNIHVHGFMGKERFEYFKRADCLLALQRFPVPFGINVLEGMAFQIPVIGFKACGPGCLVNENKAGISVGVGNDDIYKAIAKLQRDKQFVSRISGMKQAISRNMKRTGYSACMRIS